MLAVFGERGWQEALAMALRVKVRYPDCSNRCGLDRARAARLLHRGRQALDREAQGDRYVVQCPLLNASDVACATVGRRCMNVMRWFDRIDAHGVLGASLASGVLAHWMVPTAMTGIARLAVADEQVVVALVRRLRSRP